MQEVSEILDSRSCDIELPVVDLQLSLVVSVLSSADIWRLKCEEAESLSNKIQPKRCLVAVNKMGSQSNATSYDN